MEHKEETHTMVKLLADDTVWEIFLEIVEREKDYTENDQNPIFSALQSVDLITLKEYNGTLIFYPTKKGFEVHQSLCEIFDTRKTSIFKNPQSNQNIFQIWNDLGQRVPFAVKRESWNPASSYEWWQRLRLGSSPYGKAWGYFRRREQNISEPDGEPGEVRCAGCYQWFLVDDIDLSGYEESE